MKTVYVIGPVIRSENDSDLHGAAPVYMQILNVLSEAGFKVVFPVSEPFLEEASPRALFDAINQRISSSDVVISVLPESNPAGDVESAMASYLSKEQYIIASDINKTSRLLRGLPGVARAVSVFEAPGILAEIKQRHNENLNPPMLAR